MDDIRAVMDSAGSERAAILGISGGGPMSALFAARIPRAPTSDPLRHQCQDQLGARLVVSSGAAFALRRMNRSIDARDILPSIRVPTLVLRRVDDPGAAIEASRYLVEHVPGAKFVELPGDARFHFVGDGDPFVDEIQEFLTGKRTEPEPDRIPATVLLTDIADSTQRASDLGDQRWRELLGQHNALAQKAIARFRGRAIKSAGDDYLATFDGPARAIRCALAVCDESRQIGLAIRAGLHSGEVELIGEDIGGIAVHIAARVATNAQADEVWTSRSVRDLVVGSSFKFKERGDFDLKGVPGRWTLFTVGSA